MNHAPENNGNNVTPRVPDQDNASLDVQLNEAVEHHRAGGSLTIHAGLGDLAVESDDAFVEHAVALAADLPRLAELRATLRQRLMDSPLCDGPAYARNVEDAFRAMWDARAGVGKDRTS